MTAHIGIIGAGLIGRAWAIVFARSGMSVCIYDIDASALGRVRDDIRQSLQDLRQAGLIADIEAPLSLIRTENDLAHAMSGVEYVQECGPEGIDAKRRIYSELESVVAIDTVLASSTSGIAASRFTNQLKHPERCLVAHPVNPPYLIPLVEVAPSPDTSEAAVSRTMQLMKQAQQTPILVRKEVQGFILNRLQGALLNEALRLFRDGYVSAEDLDKTVKHGLGLRWSFMGPFETIDLNAPNGVVDYGQRYGPLYREVDCQRSDDNPWDAVTLAALDLERRTQLSPEDLAERQAWRDRRLMALMVHQRHIETQ
ncbi:3-hydroxyacyl-CoA dehydrogenase [Vreelandella venusta]|uniref:3-hydroxyacyl-CoA dehydrogenase n=1 Tax=Vreelandella venusta TaxID=44935 RepID=UPI0018DA69D6|nr:3-hydroxyacyl-CoA dehydrogenase [Halomonas venusta]QPI62519.1 3-hydroxyacyl-CoA dehydrogenase [Halomonas venusta]